MLYNYWRGIPKWQRGIGCVVGGVAVGLALHKPMPKQLVVPTMLMGVLCGAPAAYAAGVDWSLKSDQNQKPVDKDDVLS